jgi:hypothetical protein
MRILSRRRKATHSMASPVNGTNRYHLWADSSGVIDGPFAGPPLSESDLTLAAAWASMQEAWNMHLDVLRDRGGQARALAIAGAEGIDPEWLVYPSHGGYQTDESFESTWSPSLDEALCTIANMQPGSCVELRQSEQAGNGALLPA